MDTNCSALGIYASAEHGCGTEQYTDIAVVHRLDYRLAAPLCLTLLNKAYLMRRNTIILNQLALDFGIDIPFARLVSAEVTENEYSQRYI